MILEVGAHQLPTLIFPQFQFFYTVLIAPTEREEILLIFRQKSPRFESLMIHRWTFLPPQLLYIKFAKPINMVICDYVHAADNIYLRHIIVIMN